MTHTVVIVGGGPAGLMAAEAMIRGVPPGSVAVHVYDAMPSVGRKFLLAGKGGLNLTHAEPLEKFLGRYGTRRPQLQSLLTEFGPDALCDWAGTLGVETRSGSSGRVFPVDMKAAPLLRAWLHRLRAAGVAFHTRRRWRGWDNTGALRFVADTGAGHIVQADAVVLALGGASWPQLGSDGAWVALLEQRGVTIAPLRPANCGFDVKWSAHLRTRFAGTPVKSVLVSLPGAPDAVQAGEFILTETGVEGGVVYALSASLRDQIETTGTATLTLDLAPGRDRERLARELAQPRGSRSVSSHIQRRTGLSPVKVALLRECLPQEDFTDMARLATGIKALPVKLAAARPVTEAISSAGGVPFEALDEHLMIRALPGSFCAGEMLDWEAPTGGYLLTACFASGRAAGLGALRWLQSEASTSQRVSTSSTVL